MAAGSNPDAAAASRRRYRSPAGSWWEPTALRILVAEEDPAARARLRQLLGPHVSATLCDDGAQALWHAGRVRPSVVILSATLPVVAAADVAAVLAFHGEAPGAVAVGVGPGEADRGGSVLAAGATTVVSKPYRSSEIEPLLRSIEGAPEQRQDAAGVLSVGPLRLDGPAFEAVAAGRPMRLTLREFELLRLLMVHAGRVVSLQHIGEQLWETRGESVSRNTIAVHIRRLRRQLGAVAEIVVVRGVGYRLRVRNGSGAAVAPGDSGP